MSFLNTGINSALVLYRVDGSDHCWFTFFRRTVQVDVAVHMNGVSGADRVCILFKLSGGVSS
jgi:hypothetical protein